MRICRVETKMLKNTFLIKRYFATCAAYSVSTKIEIFDKVKKSWICKSHLVKKRNIKKKEKLNPPSNQAPICKGKIKVKKNRYC